ncbi:MAG TPA: DUF2851 family protein [Bacteroidota bacterium]|nr:DUF2851 family protein [Bacteroidota bacterium]
MADHARNIHERFLRHIWSRRYLDETRLRTSDGKPVRVIDPGRLNLDGGPDFGAAKVRIGGTTFVGDIEIHRTVSDWFAHQHQNDARYNRVILHVVLDGSHQPTFTTSLSGRTIPILILSEFLSEPIQSIWQKAILDERARRAETIRCFPMNKSVSDEVLKDWIRKLSVERLELKIRMFDERLRELAYERIMTVREFPRTYGEPPLEGFPEEIPPPLRELNQVDFSRKDIWEQVLYEGLMEGLGYAKNRQPFLRLARSVTLDRLRALRADRDGVRRAAILFAVAGLLPKIKSMRERESRDYVRTLIRSWSDVLASFRFAKLQAADWQFFPTRPNNFPTLRISAASALASRLLNEELFKSIIQVLKSCEDPAKLRSAFHRLFMLPQDDFWSHHYDFDQRTAKPMVALGISRIDELLVNTTIPVALLYARIFRDALVRERALALYESFPSMQENSITRIMEEQLLRRRNVLVRASTQQGVIHLFKYYCTDQRCGDCEVGAAIGNRPQPSARG